MLLAYHGIEAELVGTSGLHALAEHVGNEWVTLANLGLLLPSFALLARHFELSRIPDRLPDYLPDDWRGGFALLCVVFVLSSFLDNIAAALIGASIARVVFRERVHVAYLVAIVAASNAGGSGSVLGDTTTTMMWIAGVPPASVLEAYVGATVALVATGIPASIVQQRHCPIVKDAPTGVGIDPVRVVIVVSILVGAVVTNAALMTHPMAQGDAFPFLGVVVASLLGVAAFVRKPDPSVVPSALRGTLFLLLLVLSASLVPVEHLPEASPTSVLGLGFVSAVFDNIPLTHLALRQGGYDYGYVAYAVGFGGSMIWFGSSAGVAVASRFPEAQSIQSWLRQGWPVVVAYVLGYLALVILVPWAPR